ncbi:MAG: hypothetical protein AAFN77_13560 [Planctomycetota bacterium]
MLACCPDHCRSVSILQFYRLAFILLASTILLPATLMAQVTPAKSAQGQQSQQPYVPQLTPEQQAAQRKAAQEAYAEHQRQQQEALERATQAPAGFPLPANQAEYVEQLLDHWQKVSDQVTEYKCNFQRYDYDNAQVNYRDPKSNQLAAFNIAYGEVRYAAKDKASFETSRMFKFKNPPKQPGGEVEWEPVEGYSVWGKTIHERWVCDGTSVYDFDFVGKRMYETAIPSDLQGNVVESPIPFLFGANKQDIMKRYWVRYVPKYTTNAKGEKELIQDQYWLEAYPKTISDAQMYSKLEIVLAAKDFMPVAMHMYSTQYDGSKNFASRYFYFEDRQTNGQLQKFQNFFKVFVRPKLPLGWEQAKRTYGGSRSAKTNQQGGGVR